MVVERNTWTMVQERYNTQWIREQRLGIVLQSFSEIAGGIAPMLDPEQLANFRARVAAINNRAEFEIPDIVATLIASRATRHASLRRFQESNWAPRHSRRFQARAAPVSQRPATAAVQHPCRLSSGSRLLF